MFTQLARSETLSTFFPTWLWQGREWRKGNVPRYDPCYWLNAHSHPVLSTYYPTSILTAFIGAYLPLDCAFDLYIIHYLLHYGFMLAGWYVALKTQFIPLVALIGAITMTFQAYHLKQQACIVYTLSWFPWMLYGLISHNILISSSSIGAIILAGYYPLAIYLLPLSLFFWQWIPIGIGLLIGSIQLIPFIKYLPKTIKKVHTSIQTPSYENNFYFGWTPMIVLWLTFKVAYLSAYLWLGVLFLIKDYLPRVHQRAYLLISYLLIYYFIFAIQTLSQSQLILILIVQCADLYWHNRECIPARPFVELWEKPNRVFNTKLTRFLDTNLGNARVSGLPYPLFTGLVNNFKTIGYCGSMQLKLMAKWRGDSDPNGSGHHDYFRGKEDELPLVTARVRYAYSTKKLNWPTTSIRNLYQNPNYIN